jgi:hypothetical protein
MAEFSAKLTPLRELLDEYMLTFPDPVNPPYDNNKDARKLNKKKFADFPRGEETEGTRGSRDGRTGCSPPPQETERSVECERGLSPTTCKEVRATFLKNKVERGVFLNVFYIRPTV